jgi:hypothetical protein
MNIIPSGERVTLEEIESRIANEEYLRYNKTITVCNLTLDNGFSVRGESGCVSEETFNRSIGERLARQQAVNKLWKLFGFLLAETRYRRDRAA